MRKRISSVRWQLGFPGAPSESAYSATQQHAHIAHWKKEEKRRRSRIRKFELRKWSPSWTTWTGFSLLRKDLFSGLETGVNEDRRALNGRRHHRK